MGGTRQHPDQHQPTAPQCPWPTPGLPRLAGAQLEPRAPSSAPTSPCSPPALADSGAAGSFSSPCPHFPIQDIWVSSTRRRLICPLIPQAGGVQPHGDLSCCGPPRAGGWGHVPRLPRQVGASLGSATTRGHQHSSSAKGPLYPTASVSRLSHPAPRDGAAPRAPDRLQPYWDTGGRAVCPPR